MKRKLTVILLAAALCLVLMCMAACNPLLSDISKAQKNAVQNAVTFNCTATVADKGVTVYVYSKTLTVMSDSMSVTTAESTLNSSFVLEESLSKIFQIVSKHRLKVSLIQSSAISISVSLENSRYLPGALDELGNDFKVSYNTGLELLTIRGINPDIERKTTEGRQILLSQRTRRVGRFLMKEQRND